MLNVEECALVLLAAGRSARFADARSKLDQPFLGKPLGLHVVAALEDLPFGQRLAVVGRLELDYGHHGFAVIRNEDGDAGISSSIGLGVARARDLGTTSVLIVLADMPRVTAAHVMRLFDASQGDMTIAASSDGCDPAPPALFGAGRFEALMALDADTGARDLIRGGRHVVAPAAELIDVDTVQDLADLRARVRAPAATPR